MTPTPVITRFRDWLRQERNLRFADYEAMHRWSVDDLPAFWGAVWAFEDIVSPTPFASVLGDSRMPGAEWFAGAQVNYARQVFRHCEAAHADGQPAIVAEDETGPIETIDWPTLRRRVYSLALELRALGANRGDRIAAYLPNRPEAVIAFLACASIGAIWTVCAPDMGAPAVLDRFRQIEPRFLIATDGCRYAGRVHDRAEVVRTLSRELPTVEHLIVVASGTTATDIPGARPFAAAVVRTDAEIAGFEPEWLPFDHPLWVVYSSGTTGKPKALVHGHGGILVSCAATRLHMDLGASYGNETPGERFHWFSSTGWIMWNVQVSGLLSGTTICLYDGSPTAAKDAPDWSRLWHFVARNRVTFFGAGAQFFAGCVNEDVPFDGADLTSLRALGSTGSPLPAQVQGSVSQRLAGVGNPGVWWLNISGGTDIAGAFLTGNRELPDAPGKLQCRQLGAAVEAWDEDGRSVIGTVGELVCIKPMPSMPLYLWGDEGGRRYRESYFEKFPGVWCHGDWLRIDARGTCEILGRSDATINRGGHRLGSSEIYAAVQRVDGVEQAMIIDVTREDGDSELILFVVLKPAKEDTLDVRAQINEAIRGSLSPRFVPDRILEVGAIPTTLSGKKMEVPIKRLFQGWPIDTLLNPATMANPECLTEYSALAGEACGAAPQ